MALRGVGAVPGRGRPPADEHHRPRRLSVDNARRYTRERTSTETSQRGMLPAPFADIHSVRAAGVYLPTTTEGQGAGGDWYEVIPSRHCAWHARWATSSNHGLRASATMGRMRSAMQVLAQLELPPDELLAHLDDFVAKLVADDDPSHEDAWSSMCLDAVFDPVARRLAVASAGHPRPALVRPDGAVCSSVRTRGRPSAPAVCRSRARPSTSPPTARSSSTALHALDDTGFAAWPVPEDPAAVADARRETAAQLEAWNMPESVGFVMELMVSELLTNAIRYAGNPVLLRLIRTATSLVCEVTDPSNTQPGLRRARTTDGGGRGLFLVAQMCERWGSRYNAPDLKTSGAEKALSGIDQDVLPDLAVAELAMSTSTGSGPTSVER